MKAVFKKVLECPYCKGACSQDKHDKHFFKCEKCDYSYYVENGKVENLPMTGVRQIRHVSEMMSNFKDLEKRQREE